MCTTHTYARGHQLYRTCPVQPNFICACIHAFVFPITHLIKIRPALGGVMVMTGCADVTVLVQVAMPGCLQQFINHNGVLHKVYVMGDQVRTAYQVPACPIFSLMVTMYTLLIKCLLYFNLIYAGLLRALFSVRII